MRYIIAAIQALMKCRATPTQSRSHYISEHFKYPEQAIHSMNVKQSAKNIADALSIKFMKRRAN